MKVLFSIINDVARDCRCYDCVELAYDDGSVFDNSCMGYNNYVNTFGDKFDIFDAYFTLSSYGYDNIFSDKRVSMEFCITKDTDLSEYQCVAGLVRILRRLKVLCREGYLAEARGYVLLYPVSSSYYISVISFENKFAV